MRTSCMLQRYLLKYNMENGLVSCKKALLGSMRLYNKDKIKGNAELTYASFLFPDLVEHM